MLRCGVGTINVEYPGTTFDIAFRSKPLVDKDIQGHALEKPNPRAFQGRHLAGIECAVEAIEL